MKHITLDELRRMRNTEGLILQGCGGDPNEWVDGINELFTEEGILLDGSTFTDATVFENEGLTNLLFNMDDVKLNMGRLAMWKLQSRGTFGGYWVSDYLPNKLGVSMDDPIPQEQEQEKPDAPIIGADSNVFNIMGIASRTLKRAGMPDQAKEMNARVMGSGSYDAALGIIMEYVNPADADGHGQGGMAMRME
jgi:hypothetical protein